MRDQAYRSYLLTLLTVVYTFNFLDRNVLSLLMQTIKEDLHLSDTQMGLLSGMAFVFFYSTLGIPLARWADRGNRITIITLTTGLWSLMVVFCGMATNYLQLMLARVGVAVGEAGCVPPAQSLISDYYSRGERPRALSYYAAAGPISIVLGYVLAGWINEWYGWRAAFFAVGVPGIVLALAARFTLHEPRLGNRAAHVSVQSTPPMAGYCQALETLWRLGTYRHLLIGVTLTNLFSFGMAQWIPAFLMRTYHIPTAQLGAWYGLMLGVAGTVGTFLGGTLVSRYALYREGLQLKVMAALLVALMPLYAGLYLATSPYFAFLLLAVAGLLFCATFGPLFAIVQEVSPPCLRATAVAILLLCSSLIGMGLGPLGVGLLSDALASVFGENSLRIALLSWTPGFLWVAFHLLRASRHVERDIAAERSADESSEASSDCQILEH
jgi:MFS family permease